MEELKGQRVLFDTIEERACMRLQQEVDHEEDLARCDEVVAAQEAAITCREEAARENEAKQL
ncbi:hypothetical protein E2562_022126 [Oryza meyeriana var. granulata]|uniref:Uncharacterized protein n=1 Tax=Oryza meyeriana var. granulata TaxID=110450 RepID=A0A6G1BMN8_9ORYZ|nr:hypothetical protein E2562_022126 [Oryza meyeriana var. granulata]